MFATLFPNDSPSSISCIRPVRVHFANTNRPYIEYGRPREYGRAVRSRAREKELSAAFYRRRYRRTGPVQNVWPARSFCDAYSFIYHARVQPAVCQYRFSSRYPPRWPFSGRLTKSRRAATSNQFSTVAVHSVQALFDFAARFPFEKHRPISRRFPIILKSAGTPSK